MCLTARTSVVYVPKDQGTHFLHKISNKTGEVREPCPACRQMTLMQGIGLYNCVWEAWGTVVSDSRIDLLDVELLR